MLSIGCGGGTAEIKFSDYSCFEEILAIDLSEKIIQHARQKIEGKNLKLKFECINFMSFEPGNEKFDVIHFNSSLHHFFNIGKTLSKVKSLLNENGIVILNEYVGPNRFQWSTQRLKYLNEVLKKHVPSSHKKRLNNFIEKSAIYRVGLFRSILSDPSEAVHSDEILKAVHSSFNVIEEKELGGNLLHPLLKDIAHHFIDENSTNSKLLNDLFLLENELMSIENKSDFVFGIYNIK
jgi:2-polyprenyl-3-methyl-5-hydroxy-6-metoxy-1,4-benzoquinol methylase